MRDFSGLSHLGRMSRGLPLEKSADAISRFQEEHPFLNMAGYALPGTGAVLPAFDMYHDVGHSLGAWKNGYYGQSAANLGSAALQAGFLMHGMQELGHGMKTLGHAWLPGTAQRAIAGSGAYKGAKAAYRLFSNNKLTRGVSKLLPGRLKFIVPMAGMIALGLAGAGSSHKESLGEEWAQNPENADKMQKYLAGGQPMAQMRAGTSGNVAQSEYFKTNPYLSRYS